MEHISFKNYYIFIYNYLIYAFDGFIINLTSVLGKLKWSNDVG